MSNYEFISVIIVMRNEENYIEKCLLSILNQDYPKDKYEVIVVDGESTDKSVDIVSKYVDEFNVKIINNPKRNLASGWNLGIKNAKGNIVIRPDAHSTIEPDFIKKNIETLAEKTDAVCVGGKINSICNGSFIAKSISSVLSSPFGVGNSQFRIGNKAQYVDTVAYGAYRKYIFDKCGYFNEHLDRNQDLEMHSRIKESGGKFYFNPDIKSNYYTRNTFKGFVTQAYRNGKWNIITLNWQKNALSIRHLIPLIFVLSMLLNIVMSFIVNKWKYILLAEVVSYILAMIIGAIKIGINNGITYALISPLLFLSLHVSYGIGSMVGIISLLKLKLQRS